MGLRAPLCGALLFALGTSVTHAQNATTPQDVATVPMMHAISVYARYVGDDDGDNQARLFFRRADEGEDAWRNGLPMAVFRSVAPKEWRGCAINVEPSTAYVVRVVFTDEGVTTVAEAMATTESTEPVRSAPGMTYTVAVNGSDTNSGTEDAPFRTIQRAADAVVAGDCVIVRPGIYYEDVQINASGQPGNYIVFESETPRGAILDGGRQDVLEGAVAWTPLGTGTYKTAQTANPLLVGVGDKRMRQYPTPADLEGAPATEGGWAWASGELSVRLPGGASPLTAAMHVSERSNAFRLTDKSYVAILGFEMRYQRGDAIMLRTESHSVWIQENTIYNYSGDGYDGAAVQGKYGPRRTFLIGNHVFQRVNFAYPEGQVAGHPELPLEPNGFYYWRGGGGYIVWKNLIEGANHFLHDGFSGGPMQDGGSPYRDAEVFQNTVTETQDDGIQVEGANINVCVWQNRTVHCNLGIACAPVGVGPLYVIRNEIIETQDSVYKLGESSYGIGFFFHNTIFSPALSCNGIAGYGGNGIHKNLTFRNNIIQVGRKAATKLHLGNDLDYNNLHRSDTSRALVSMADGPDYATWEDFRTGTGYEPHGFSVVESFRDRGAKDFRLALDSPLMDQGQVIIGVNDGFAGSGPDLGAHEGDEVTPIGSESQGLGPGSGPGSPPEGTTPSPGSGTPTPGRRSGGRCGLLGMEALLLLVAWRAVGRRA